MRTTLNLSETLIAELMKVSSLKTKTEALYRPSLPDRSPTLPFLAETGPP